MGEIQLIASRGKFSSSGFNVSGGNTSRTNLSRHVIYKSAGSAQFICSNFQKVGTTEADGANAITVQMGINYPIGSDTFIPVTFSGSATKLINPGEIAKNDAVDFTFPDGAVVMLHTHVSVASGGQWPAGLFLKASDGEGGAPANVNYAMSHPPSLQDSYGYTPNAIVGIPVAGNYGHLAFIADSIGYGQEEANIIGYMAKAAELAQIPYMNLAIAGDSAANFATNHSRRYALLQAANIKYVWQELGINDLPNSNNASLLTRIQDNATALKAIGVQKVFQSTITPKGQNSSDGWITVAGQTMHSNNNSIPALNDAIRASSVFDAVIDASDTVAVNSANVLTRNGSNWKTFNNTSAVTADGVHMKEEGSTYIANSLYQSLIDIFVDQTEPLIIKQGRFLTN